MPDKIIDTSLSLDIPKETSDYYKDNVEFVVNYNRVNGTNFYKREQVLADIQKRQELARAQSIASNPDPEDVRDAYIAALNPQTTEDVDRIRKFDEDAAKTAVIGTAVGTSPFWGPAAGYAMGVLANPATASTTLGSIAATGADLAGLYLGGKGLISDANKVASGQYKWQDVPITGLNLLSFAPGSSVLTRLGNWNTAINTGRQAVNTTREVLPIMTSKQYFQALPQNVKSLTTTYTKSGKKALQQIADDTYTAMNNRVEEIAKSSKFPNIHDVGTEVGFPERAIMTARGDFGNPTIRVDVTDPKVMEIFDATPASNKVNYIFSLNPNAVQMAGYRGTNGIVINRAHFLFPFKNTAGEWKMIGTKEMPGDIKMLVGHEAGHAGMSQINPLKGIKPFKLNGNNFNINLENELFHSGRNFQGLIDKSGTHDGLPEEYLSDYFGELATRGLPQNTNWNRLDPTVRTSILNSISQRRNLSIADTQQILDGLSEFGYIGTKSLPIKIDSKFTGSIEYLPPSTQTLSIQAQDPILSVSDNIKDLRGLRSFQQKLQDEAKFVRGPLLKDYRATGQQIEALQKQLYYARQELDPIVNNKELKNMFVNKQYWDVYNYLKDSSSPILWEVRKEFLDTYNFLLKSKPKQQALTEAGEQMRNDLLLLYTLRYKNGGSIQSIF